MRPFTITAGDADLSVTAFDGDDDEITSTEIAAGESAEFDPTEDAARITVEEVQAEALEADTGGGGHEDPDPK